MTVLLLSEPPTKRRVFILLQGPHGPFFGELAQMLESAGAKVVRIGFNAGDERFWPKRETYLKYAQAPESWAMQAPKIFSDLGATDLVVYGDVRPIHASALKHARRLGLKTHIFEEGYLRPSWVTYERFGTNGYSPLMDMSLSRIKASVGEQDSAPFASPATWGEMRQHIWHGARYQFHVLLRNAGYPGFTPHRALNVRQEFGLYAKKLAWLPVRAVRRSLATQRIKSGGFPYHLFLLQLEHDSSFTAHCDFDSLADVVADTVAAFAHYAPPHHHLVFKAHPLEDGRARLQEKLAKLSDQHRLRDRLHFVAGGKLAPLLDPARSVVTVNSTAAQQALWRGIPVKALGRAVYCKPGLTSDQPLGAFFQDPQPPNRQTYREFRRFLLETSQVTGGFYAKRGRRKLLRRVVDLMLAESDPYDALRIRDKTEHHSPQTVRTFAQR
ncbi:MAG: capsule biosynthesis protein CapA [Pseudomonadota bacterium]